MLVQIQIPPLKKAPQQLKNKFALFNLGFRPFFLGAGIFAVISITLWMLVYNTNIHLQLTNISPSQWHAHEMLYGYSMAVVAGFLLTAVKNWTGIQTTNGKPLMLLLALWASARILFLFGTQFLLWVALADLLFDLLLIIAISIPIVKSRQWKQIGVVSKVVLLTVGNLYFYLACFGIVTTGMQYAIYGAVLLFVGLILMISRRVLPFFIERGTDKVVQLTQYKWLDISIMVLFMALFINVILIHNAIITALFSWAIFILNGYRLFNWHIYGLWRVPLLWSLYTSAWLINIGFLFYGIQTMIPHLAILTIHIFTIGGIGLITLGMMSRVALGHTGREIRKPSAWLSIIFAGIIISVIFRSFVPMLTSQHYINWVMVSSILWILSFSIFTLIYAPILVKPRVDGAWG
ncbi:MAG: NnrS family protein [Methylophilaceae bacterium]